MLRRLSAEAAAGATSVGALGAGVNTFLMALAPGWPLLSYAWAAEACPVAWRAHVRFWVGGGGGCDRWTS